MSRVRAFAFAFSLAISLVQAEPPKLDFLFPAGGQVGASFVMTANASLDPLARLTTESPDIHFVPTGKKREWQVTIVSVARPGLYLVNAINADGVSQARWFSVGTHPEVSETEPNDEVGKPQPLEKLPLCVNARLEKAGDVDNYQVTLAQGQTLVGMVEAYALGSGVDMIAHVLDDQGVRLMTASDARNLDPVLVFKAPKAGKYTVQLAGFAHPPLADVRFVGGPAVVYRLHLASGPAVTQVFPAAVAEAGKTEVDLIGSNLDPKKSRHTVDAAQIRRTGSMAWLTPPGALLPIQVLVTPKAAVIEKEPNQTKEQAMPVGVGHVAGRIGDKNDVDRFAIPLKKGDRMLARVWSKALGLPLDAQIKIEGPDGALLTTVDDQSEQMPDPQTIWKAAADGVYQIIVEDLFHQGNADKAYVLELAQREPSYDITLADAKPLVIEPGKAVSIKATVKFQAGFKGPLVLRVSGLPAGVFAAEAPVPEKSGEVEIKLQAAADAPTGQSHPISVEAWTKTEPFQMEAALAPLRGESLRGTSALDAVPSVWLTVKGK